MHPTRYAPRPELGELKPGQPVMVYRSYNNMRHRDKSERFVPAEVVKAARVWVELKQTDLKPSQIGHRTWRMRRDTQNEGTQYSGSNASFATIEQYEWDETMRWARGYLEENGIRVEHRSKWHGREIELADIISQGTDRTSCLAELDTSQ